MEDVECPYCEKWNEINHDDGYGYEEGETYEQTCDHCGKIFVYTTSIHFYYDAKKAPCKNGGEHDWKKIDGWPKEYFKNRRRCSCCDEEMIINPEQVGARDCSREERTQHLNKFYCHICNCELSLGTSRKGKTLGHCPNCKSWQGINRFSR